MTTGDIYSVVPGLSGGTAVTVDSAGNLVASQALTNQVRVWAARTGRFYGQAMTAGHIYTAAGTGVSGFAGDGGPAAQAELFSPSAAAVDGAGNLVIADTDNERIRVVAAKTSRFYGQAMTAGHIYTVAGAGPVGFSGDGGPGTKGRLSSPIGVAADAAGNILIADFDNDRIREVQG